MNSRRTALGSSLCGNMRMVARLCTASMIRNFRPSDVRRGGELLAPGDDIPASIMLVVKTLDFDPVLADECIADLPAIEM